MINVPKFKTQRKWWPLILAVAAFVWVISPFDADFVPILGWIDDLVAAIIGISSLLAFLRRNKREDKKD